MLFWWESHSMTITNTRSGHMREQIILRHSQNTKVTISARQILIYKAFAPYLQKIDAYAPIHDVELIINQAYRADERKVSRAIVEPGKLSNHLSGFAIHFNIESNGITYFAHHLKRKKLNNLRWNVQNFIRSIRNDKDLRWCGDFIKDDPIRIDHPINVMNRSKWASYKT